MAGLERRHLRPLRIKVLFGGHTLRFEPGRAFKIEASIGELRFVLCLVGLRLLELCAKRPRVDLREDVTLVHVLALGERDTVELPVDPHFYRDGVERLNRADPGKPDRDIPGLGPPHGDRHSRRAGR